MLDPYELKAVTASAKTLDQLVKMAKSDNNRWKLVGSRRYSLDVKVVRKLDVTHCECLLICVFKLMWITNPSMPQFSCLAFTIPEYELVVLRPEHLLLPGSSIHLADNEAKTETKQVVATDHRLCKSHDPQSPSFPAFRHPERGDARKNLNVFLVVLNTDIGFRHYFETIKTEPPAAPPPG